MTPAASRDEVILTTCPRDCYDSCGIKVIKRDGAITAVRGDPDHPVSRGALCGKCSTAYNREWRDPARRLTEPLRRSRDAKGDGGFEPVSWERPSPRSPTRLQRIVASHGSQVDPQCALHRHHIAARGHGADALLQSTGRDRGDARHHLQHGRPRRAALYVRHLAGRISIRARRRMRPASSSGARIRMHRLRMPTTIGCRRRPGKIVVVDPIRTPTAAQADIHLQPFPGSDAALAFALLHVIQRDGLIDESFIARHVKRLGGTRAGDGGVRSCAACRGHRRARCRSSNKSHTCMRRDPRCSGSVRVCSARRRAAMSCVLARYCPRSPAIWASAAPGFCI